MCSQHCRFGEALNTPSSPFQHSPYFKCLLTSASRPDADEESASASRPDGDVLPRRFAIVHDWTWIGRDGDSSEARGLGGEPPVRRVLTLIDRVAAIIQYLIDNIALSLLELLKH